MSREILTAMQRFEAYCKANGVSKSGTLIHMNKMAKFEEQERKELRKRVGELEDELRKLKNEKEKVAQSK